jgi:hypothetical protein
MLCRDNALLIEIGEILHQESKDLVLDRKAKPKEEASHGRKNVQRQTSSLKQLPLSWKT